jgi:hypothetical protein
VTNTGCLLATSDNEIGKIGPVPSGCGATPLASIVLTGPNDSRHWTAFTIGESIQEGPFFAFVRLDTVFVKTV